MSRCHRLFLLPALCVGVLSLSHASALKVEPVVADGILYTVATVNPATDRLQLHWLNPSTGAPYATFAQLRARLHRERRTLGFATNSGIYAPGLKPLGLHVEQGRTLVPLNMARSGGNFALLPNGVFWVKGARVGVTETRRYATLNVQPTFATQSGPLLLQGGKVHPEFNRGSTSFKLRSGVGVCRDGRVRFAVSAGPVNFYSFAVFFRDTLDCPDALYLDGSISAYATGDRSTQLADFAGIWSVTR
ncbi:phosphodiester glycosidase family protein [Deinococcus sp.]|uniref:phosphodiester glycosidase family protein n=1 Tax=Deinococcus sp. TaxID=47478 RepID=UPI0025C5C62D|nr:phosphodiester glycosidase family protein [Deinococcus sp.]